MSGPGVVVLGVLLQDEEEVTGVFAMDNPRESRAAPLKVDRTLRAS